ncbi:MAG TPA: F0F1 ATP synthase subunit epsilon [Planctomycetota bacterium]|nr:F0F1 ATP synthase subunit epsilon [Planctomycetota bacterium]
MARTFRLEIVTPEKIVYSEDVISVVVPAEKGYLGVLAGHAPLLCTIRPGEIRVRREGGEVSFATSGGFMEVTQKKATVLSESAEPPTAIDAARAAEAKRRARERLSNPAKEVDRDRAQAALERAENRLRISKKRGS